MCLLKSLSLSTVRFKREKNSQFVVDFAEIRTHDLTVRRFRGYQPNYRGDRLVYACDVLNDEGGVN